MVLYYHQELADSLDMAVAANEFISACPSRKNVYICDVIIQMTSAISYAIHDN